MQIFEDPEFLKRLEQIVRAMKAGERADRAPSTYSLINDVFLRCNAGAGQALRLTAEDLGLICRLVRNTLIDRARSEGRLKRGGGRHRDALEGLEVSGAASLIEQIEFKEAMEKLEQEDPDGAQVIDMRFVCGMTEDEIASALGVSRRTISARYARARGLLRTLLYGESEGGDAPLKT